MPVYIPIQRPIDLQNEVRDNFGLVQFPEFELSTGITPVVITNLPDAPLLVRNVAAPQPQRIYEAEDPFTNGRNWTYAGSQSLRPGDAAIKETSLVLTLKQKQPYRLRYAMYGQFSAGWTGVPLTFGLLYNNTVYLDLVYDFAIARAAGTESRLLLDSRGYVDFILPPDVGDITTDSVFLKFENNTTDAQRIDTWGMFASIAALTYNPP